MNYIKEMPVYNNRGYNKNFENKYTPEGCQYCGYADRSSSSWQSCISCPFKKMLNSKKDVKI